MIRFILTILDLFKGIFVSMGINYTQLRTILRIKLTMDNRRSLSNNAKKKSSKNQLLLQGFIYAFIGLYFSFFLSKIEAPLEAYLIIFSIIMAMIAVVMISEFSTVLIDTRDNHILLPRPIDSRTMAMAKILHIGIYLMHISLSISLASIITTWVIYGFLSACIFLICLIMATLFTLFLTNIFYLGVMKFVNGEKLKDILVYFQVFMAILFMGAYQIMPRLMDMTQITSPHLQIHWWTYLIPPAWFGGSMQAFIQGSFDSFHLPFIIGAVAVPPLALYLVIDWLSPKFSERISQLDVAGSKTTKKREESEKSESKNSIVEKIANIVTHTPSEATAFKMVWLMSGRERKYKQTVFPSFGYIFIFALVFAFRDIEDFKGGIDALAGTSKHILFMYISALAAMATTLNLCYSDEPKSSWFYRSVPLDPPGQILCGAIKSVLVKYYLPLYLLIAVPVLYIWGPEVIDDLIYAFIAIITTSVIMSYMNLRSFPFSKERETQESSGNFLKGIFIMISMSILGLLHWGLTYVPYGIYISIPVMIFLLHITFRSYARLSWKNIEN